MAAENIQNLENNQAFSGTGSHEEVEALNKALNPGGPQYTGTPDSIAGAGVFLTESLEPTLKIVSEVDKHVILFNLLSKSRAFNLVEEFDLQSQLGGAGTAWIEESDVEPREEDAQYDRRFEVVKYLGVKKRIHHITTQLRSGHGDVVAKETKNGVSYLLREIERALYAGQGFFNVSGEYDGSESFSNTFFAWRGMDKQLRAGFNDAEFKQKDFAGFGDDLSHIVDMDAQILSPEAIEEACRVALEEFGSPDKLLLSPKAHSDFSRSYYPKERFNDGQGNIIPGLVVPAINTSLGRINLMSSRFLSPKQKHRGSADNSSVPNAPASVTEVDTNAADTDLEAGDYIYKVAAVNKHGEGASAVSGAITAAAGDRVQIQIADPGAGVTPDAFAVYRSDKGGAASTCKFIGYVKRAGATTNFIDLNKFKPGSSQAYLLQNDADTMTMRQLTPMLKIDFATIGLYKHWVQVFYGTPIVFKPNYNVLIENIEERAANI